MLDAMSRLYHKALALGGLFWISLNNAFIFSQSTGLVRALLKNDEGITLTKNQISLIASSLVLLNFIGFSSAGVIADKIGRRWSFMSYSILYTTYSIILYNARTMSIFMFSKVIGSIAFGGLQCLLLSVSSEYTSPRTRAFYHYAINSVAPTVGTGFAHCIGIVLHWRTVTLISIFSSATGIFLPYYWVESPHWLASRGKPKECEQSFSKLHGDKSVKELHDLIKLEQTKIEATEEYKAESAFKRLRIVASRGYFWRVIFLATSLYAYMAVAGKIVFSTLATVMLEELTGTSDILLFTLLVDCFAFVGSILSCLFIRKTSMRTLLFSSGFAGNAVLLVLSISLYYKQDEVYFKWIIVILLAVYFIILNAGPYPVLEALMSEIFPLDIKKYVIFLSGIIIAILFSSSVVLYPLMVASMGYHGMFLTNAIIIFICLAYIWIKLPETKGRTLQEIEVFFKTNDFDVDEALNNVQLKPLI